MRIATGWVVTTLMLTLGAAARADDKPAAAAAPVAATPAPKEAGGPYRPLVRGVFRTVDPEADTGETFANHDVVELLAANPQFDWAQGAQFHRDVWHLEFSFKLPRFVWVDMPQPSGKMQRKMVRYLVYTVTNPGKARHPVINNDGTIDRKEEGTYQVQTTDLPVRFIPDFALEAQRDGKTLSYPDRILPLALASIRTREDPNRKFYTSTEMAAADIKPGETRWGVATWIDVDPQITKFSIFVQGLSNAYHWQDLPGKYKKGDKLGTGRWLSRKTLKLNFWRAGDEFYEHENEVHLGQPSTVDYEWIYR